MSHQSQLTENTNIHPRRLLAAVTMVVGWLFTLGTVTAQYLDNNSIYSNQDPHTEPRSHADGVWFQLHSADGHSGHHR